MLATLRYEITNIIYLLDCVFIGEFQLIFTHLLFLFISTSLSEDEVYEPPELLTRLLRFIELLRVSVLLLPAVGRCGVFGDNLFKVFFCCVLFSLDEIHRAFCEGS